MEPHHQYLAYSDMPIVAEDQGVLVLPQCMARLLACSPSLPQKALVIGEGASYTAAILGEMMAQVILLEAGILGGKTTEVLVEHPNVFLMESALEKERLQRGPLI